MPAVTYTPNPAASVQTKLAKTADSAVSSGYLKFCWDVTLIHCYTEEEKLVSVLSQTDRFVEVIKAVREIEPDRRWEVYETIEQPF